MRFTPAHKDEKLIRGCAKGKRAAQQALYQKYYEQMMRVCMRYAGNEGQALEILNDGFLKVFDRIKSFRSEGALGAWIRQIMVRTALDSLRSQQTYQKHLNQLAVEWEDRYMGNEGELVLESEDIFQHLQALPPVSRTVFNLYALEGYSHKEIAEKLSMSEGTFQWHLSTARKKLKTQFLNKGRVRA
jgi:RNA polymerase sigma-70 factor (ECF subfamily)